MSDTPTPEILAAWPQFDGATVRPFGTGLINHTFLVERGASRWVLQKLHRVFGAVVNEDIDAVTRHLEQRQVVTPRVLPARDGRLWADDGEDGRPWRVLSFVDGSSVDVVDSAERAREAGRLVGRFHGALADFSYEYRHVRAGVHDTERHLAVLHKAVADHRSHRLYERVAPVAEALLRSAKALPDFSKHPKRHAHGDLKISNLLFDAKGRGLCLVDLDTVARMPWPHEMGDALRSWCNPAGEDGGDRIGIDLSIFTAAVEGYAASAKALTPAEDHERLVQGVATICLELSARFLADALNESYFGWDRNRFPARGEHNLHRGLGQWALAQSVEKNREALESAVRRAWRA